MKTKDIAKIIGVSRQGLENVVNGRRNFSYLPATKAKMLFDVELDVWLNKAYTEERKKLFRELRDK